MREYLFHGKRVYDGEWIEADFRNTNGMYPHNAFIVTYTNEQYNPVFSESVGQYTGMNEFMLTDESRNAKLFEGDIVEVWGWRSVYGRNQSQYDKRIKVRGVIRFNSRGQWCVDYKNKYNEVLAKPKGSETDKRQAEGAFELYYYGYHGSDIEGYRSKELEWHRKYHNDEDIIVHCDIVKIGTVFDNADLLEG